MLIAEEKLAIAEAANVELHRLNRGLRERYRVMAQRCHEAMETLREIRDECDAIYPKTTQEQRLDVTGKNTLILPSNTDGASGVANG